VPRVAYGPKFVQFFDPVLKALKQLGGSARRGEVVDVVARLKNISEAQRQEVLQSGALRLDNQIAFARQYLVWGGYLDSSKRGVWSLTEKGLAAPGLTGAEALSLFKEQHALHLSATPKDEVDGDGKFKRDGLDIVICSLSPSVGASRRERFSIGETKGGQNPTHVGFPAPSTRHTAFRSRDNPILFFPSIHVRLRCCRSIAGDSAVSSTRLRHLTCQHGPAARRPNARR